MKEELRHELVRLTYSPEIVSFELTREQGLEILKEIKRLNNIINEFDKWLLGEKMLFYRSCDNERLIRYGETKNKWLELKGVIKSE